jgi:hypothetical protein
MERKKVLRDYYKILDVRYDASSEEIRSAYRRLVKQYHPDVSDYFNAEQKMRSINEAYEILSDSTKKAVYDFIFFGYGASQKTSSEQSERTTQDYTRSNRKDSLTIYEPGPVQREISRIIVFLIRWQGKFLPILLIPVFFGAVAVAFKQWEIGAGFMVIAGILAFIAVTLTVVAQLFSYAGVNLE